MTRFARLSSRLAEIARMFALAAFTLALANLTSSAAPAPDDKRVALVIGNGAYENAVRLDNAAFDARAVADAFRKLGFQVIDGYDLDIAEMRAKISEFSADLSNAKSAVIYYAGHGVSVDDENYLIPTDIVIKSPTDLDLNAISISLLLKEMKLDEGVNIVILDACRDNPFAAELARHKTRSIVGERGLSRIDGDLARGTLIAFASDPRSKALDGPAGRHSPFTEAFLAHVFDPGVSIDTIMSRVRAEVWEKTGHSQLPWVNTSLIGEYVLNPQPPAADAAKATAGAAPDAQPADKRAQENLLWESAQHSNLSADYQAYLDAFPSGVFAQMAKNRIANLKDAEVSGAAHASQTLAAAEPAGASEKETKENAGTAETEKELSLIPADENELQQRLTVLHFYKGPATGTLDSPTRSALAEWQKQRGFAPTSFLDSSQLAALRAESETDYQEHQKRLSAQPPPAQAPRRAFVTPAPKPAHRVTKAPPPEPRQMTRRPPPRVPAVSAGPPDPGGSPAWRKRAGLPDTPGTPDMGGRPPGFWTRPAGF